MFEIIPFGSRQDDWFDRFFDIFEKSFWGTGSDLASFRADCSDDGKNFIVEAELPGFKKEDISLDVDGDTLTIHAEHKDEKDSSDSSKNYVKKERFYGSYERSFDVADIDVDSIKAEYNNGILKLTMPKKPELVSETKHLMIE